MLSKAMSAPPSSSPSPTAILKSVNNSGNYMCRSNPPILMPSPTYQDSSPLQTNMQQHQQQLLNRNNMQCRQQELDRYDYDENEDNNSKQQQQYQQYHNNFNYSQNQHQHQHPNLTDSQQQQSDQQLNLRMNQLGNERLNIS